MHSGELLSLCLPAGRGHDAVGPECYDILISKVNGEYV